MSEDEENNRSNQNVGVGALLRASRIRQGHDLRQIAETLRIRHVHLLAIEEGRYSELPGSAYTTGFIRTYAEYLGLDGQEVIRRFRNEGKGVISPDLSFRTPIQEKRIPGGAILLISLVLSIVSYGGWLYISANGRSFSDMIPDIPLKLHRLLKKDAPAASNDKDALSAEDGKSPGMNEHANASSSEPQDAAAIKEPPLPVVAPIVPVTQIAALSPSAPALPLPTLKTNAQLHPQEEPPKRQDSPPETPSQHEAPTTPINAKIFGQTSGDVRIIITAISDSWIQVSENSGEAISTRVLKKGEVYRVPTNRNGLKLGTGNAGALEITVDGHKVPPIGASGMVRRDVPLDPDKLKAGQTQ